MESRFQEHGIDSLFKKTRKKTFFIEQKHFVESTRYFIELIKFVDLIFSRNSLNFNKMFGRIKQIFVSNKQILLDQEFCWVNEVIWMDQENIFLIEYSSIGFKYTIKCF